MPTFYLTVQNRYRQQTHPKGLHPDGWVEITASSYEEAYQTANRLFGTAWGNLYEEHNFDAKARSWYPKGCIGKAEDLQ